MNKKWIILISKYDLDTNPFTIRIRLPYTLFKASWCISYQIKHWFTNTYYTFSAYIRYDTLNTKIQKV